MGRRTLLLIASILVAAVGTALVFLYVNGADQRARKDAKFVSVVVASQDIQAGQKISGLKSSFTFAQFPQGVLSADYYPGTDAGLSALLKNGDDTAIASIAARQVILRRQFVGPSEASTSGIGNKQVAASIQLDDPLRVAGIIRPDSHVTVYYTNSGSGSSSNSGTAFSQVLLADVRVISVGNSGQSASEESASGAAAPSEAVDRKIIALSLEPQQVATLRAAEAAGDLSLAVIGPGATVPATIYATAPAPGKPNG